MPLTDTAICNAKPLDKPYKLSDAQGLYLLIKPNGSKLCQLKYRFGGKEKKLAFGAYPTVTLANARKLREEARAVLSAGDDPGVRYSERGAKMKTPHLVPLSKQAVTVLKQLKLLSGNSELLFPSDHDPRKPMSENTINKALRVMGYDTNVDVCGHGFRTMACSALIESGRWSKDAVERQMSHQERNNVRAAYIHKAEHLDERTQMMQWWSDYLDDCRQKFVAPYRYDRQVQVA
ncbi:TPA: tyrosine-type recombinase/integrase [Enterobacter hormaechei]